MPVALFEAMLSLRVLEVTENLTVIEASLLHWISAPFPTTLTQAKEQKLFGYIWQLIEQRLVLVSEDHLGITQSGADSLWHFFQAKGSVVPVTQIASLAESVGFQQPDAPENLTPEEIKGGYRHPLPDDSKRIADQWDYYSFRSTWDDFCEDKEISRNELREMIIAAAYWQGEGSEENNRIYAEVYEDRKNYLLKARKYKQKFKKLKRKYLAVGLCLKAFLEDLDDLY